MEAADSIQLFSRPPKRRKAPKLHHGEAKEQPSIAAAAQAAHEQADLQQQQPQAADPPLPDRAQAGASSSSAPVDLSDLQATSFKDLGVSDWLCSVLKTLGITTPTQVQAGCIPAIMAGRDVIGLAQTGSGKTAAFALPILQRLAQDPYGIYALVLTPTRELAVQLAEQFRAFGAGMSLREAVVIGGMDATAQAKQLAARPHVVIATPGRLSDLLTADTSLATGFSRTRCLVMDEADRLLDPSFGPELGVVLGALPRGGRQTLLFSATLTPSLVKLQQSGLEDAFVFQAYEGLQTADKLKEQYVFIPAKVKDVYLYHLLTSLDQQSPRVRSAIIFVSTCRGCQALSLLLGELGLPCAALHSGKKQAARLAALASFKSEQVPLLLATDVASRGLDIPSVDLVVNYDLPVDAKDYVHRVGRTARAGRGGWSLSFVTQYDVDLVHAIEGVIGHQLAEHVMEEGEVLKAITRVYAAKRAANLALLEQEGKDGGAVTAGSKRKFKKNRGGLGAAAPAAGAAAAGPGGV